MPTYVYEVVEKDGSGGEMFEVVQSMSEEALTEHPETGKPVRRVIQPPNLPKKWTTDKVKSSMSDKRLGELGFTKYVKSGDGQYEKTVGSGPDGIGTGS